MDEKNVVAETDVVIVVIVVIVGLRGGDCRRGLLNR